MSRDDTLHTRIWLEQPEPDNPFAARVAYCHGYDVFGEMLGRARWVEMLYLLFQGERPDPQQAALLEALALALANPGPRDPSIHAAMCGGVGGSTAAASLIAALAVGAGGTGGAHEVMVARQWWQRCGTDLAAWRAAMATPEPEEANTWPALEHPPGFDPNGATTPTTVRQALSCCATLSPGPHLPWLAVELTALEEAAGLPLSLAGLAAAAFADLGCTPAQSEMLYLLLRLPGAAAHALEQTAYGFKRFPFYPIDLGGPQGVLR
ncbi:hypothetical protein [Chitinimonas lacunae]|uniref:Citryl-CoA lyase n=1 Tax=Chitinimonas lacunae TaxID=1963018 RepID=A0ABV8MNK2_9NEIS